MATEYQRVRSILDRLQKIRSIEEWRRMLAPDRSPAPPRMRNARHITESAIAQRWTILLGETDADATDRDLLADPATRRDGGKYERSIENFVGTVKVPVGVAGPLRVRGTFANDDYYVPLATSEAALVASYQRGSQVITEAGGCTASLVNEGVSRAPGFAFASLADAGEFVQWLTNNFDIFKQVAEQTTRFGELLDLYISLEGNHVYLTFQYFTGDAAGQNMVTIATEAVCNYIRQKSPVPPKQIFVEANFSGDKKASALSFLTVRGKKVSAEVVIPREIVEKRLHTTPEVMTKYWRMGTIGGVMSGTMGTQGQYANGLAALYIATGQDAACVSESAVGVTRMEITDAGELYGSVTLPNLIVGTVGGGTSLPSQHACLRIANSAGEGRAKAFAEIGAALCLAGEISLIAAMCAGDYTRAHQRLARSRHSVAKTAE